MSIFGTGLRGAGDTIFPFVVEMVVSWMLLLIPTFIACVYFNCGLMTAWSFPSFDFVAIGLALFIRHKAGRWRELRVVDDATPTETS